MTTREKAELWLKKPFDEETINLVKDLIENNPNGLEDSFYRELEFGTGGMRGIMGVGTNRLNKYTLGQATQGLANYMKDNLPLDKLKVAIAYDVRHNSNKFAKIVADVLTANGISVYLFEDFRPTPELSFAVRKLNCSAGIVLTASHNPPEYNGYKVYWTDGGQIVPPQDDGIIKEVYSVSFDQINYNGDDSLLTYIGQDIDDKFISESIKNSSIVDFSGKENLKIVFTSLHGTSIKIIPDALLKAGFSQVTLVEEQKIPSGDFPTVKSPNPEEPEALSMALKLANDIQADIVIGTDPDADRLGIAVRDLDGNLVLLNGNQTNTVLTHFLLTQLKNKNKLTGNEFIGSTIVTSDIFFPMAKLFGVECKVSLTGFKWIANMIREAEGKQKFVCGGEESFGFMVGDFVRDKDSVTSTLLACEIAAYMKSHGSSFFKYLLDIYTQTGYYHEELISITKKGIDGAGEIQQMMKQYRENPPTIIAGSKVVKIDDYKISESKNILTGEVSNINIPKSNVLIFYTEDGSKIAARPSGTEPKIKFYFSVQDFMKNIDDYTQLRLVAIDKIKQIKQELNLI